MLRAGTTCADAIKFLEDELLRGSLNDVANRVPGSMSPGPGRTYEQVLDEIRAARNRYDQWTWRAAEEINRRFADREISRQLRAIPPIQPSSPQICTRPQKQPPLVVGGTRTGGGRALFYCGDRRTADSVPGRSGPRAAMSEASVRSTTSRVGC
ncbi:hypothetical protein HEK616_84690 (plasmid) [Streptomyces nigrescens]|uniref:Uncharacterized protein n=1 Tax=Streptomyces nigrescens TaxID=1920 RepID=A0ABN6RB18_STRNI|nr:hypothetical protein HEK616_84690 [Streptomyces nigrescens]